MTTARPRLDPVSSPERTLGMREARSTRTAPIGFGRTALSADDVAEIRPRELNWKLALLLAFGAGAFLIGVHVAHGRNIARQSSTVLALARTAQADGNLVRARDYFGQYTQLVRNDINVLAEYGLLIDQTRNRAVPPRNVFAVFEEVLRHDPAREDIRQRQVLIALETGRTSDALTHVRTLLQTHPTNGELHALAGRCLAELGQYPQAIEELNVAIQLSPRLVSAFELLASIYRDRLNEPERSTAVLKALIEQNSSNAQAWFALARNETKSDRLEDAEQAMRKALELAPDDVAILSEAAKLACRRAELARSIGQIGRADEIAARSLQELDRVLVQKPSSSELLIPLIVLQSRFGDADAARLRLDELIKRNPNDSRLALLSLDVAMARHDLKAAAEVVETLPRSAASDALKLFIRGLQAASQSRLVEAVEFVEAARRAMSHWPSMMERADLLLANWHEQLNDPVARLEDFRRILKYRPESMVAHLGLAQCVLRSGALPEAMAEYRALVRHPRVPLLLARLSIMRNLQLPEVAQDWTEAETLLQTAKNGGTSRAEIEVVRAELAVARGRPDDAAKSASRFRGSPATQARILRALTALAELKSDNIRAELWRGQATILEGPTAEGERHLREAARLAQVAMTANASDQRQQELFWQTNRALLSFLMDQRRAADALQRLAEVEPLLTVVQRADGLVLCGREQQAADLLQIELRQTPDEPRCQLALAELFLKHKLIEHAEPLLRELVSEKSHASETDRATARRHLAILLSTKSDSLSYAEALRLSVLRGPKDARRDSPSSIQESSEPERDDIRVRAFVLASSSLRAEQQEAVEWFRSLEQRDELTAAEQRVLDHLLAATAGENAKAPAASNSPSFKLPY